RGRSTGRERPGGGYPRSGDRARGSERTWAGRDEAPARPPRESGPQLPESVTPEQLDPEARSQLNSLPNDLADIVARYLVAAELAAGRADEARYAFARAAQADPDGETDAADRLDQLDGIEFDDLEDDDLDLDAGDLLDIDGDDPDEPDLDAEHANAEHADEED